MSTAREVATPWSTAAMPNTVMAPSAQAAASSVTGQAVTGTAGCAARALRRRLWR